jgi:hypothetical protein
MTLGIGGLCRVSLVASEPSDFAGLVSIEIFPAPKWPENTNFPVSGNQQTNRKMSRAETKEAPWKIVKSRAFAPSVEANRHDSQFAGFRDGNQPGVRITSLDELLGMFLIPASMAALKVLQDFLNPRKSSFLVVSQVPSVA